MIDITKFQSKTELFRFLVENKGHLIAQKKFELKKADAVSRVSFFFKSKEEGLKSSTSPEELMTTDVLLVSAVINTTGLLDSHGDVHIKGLWKKSIRENKSPYHLQEHDMHFESVISDEVKVYTKDFTWKELGYNADGSTEALMFDSTVRKERNPYMFEQYAKQRVKNHSVGMRYVNLFLCINSDEEYFRDEKKNWDKYIDQVINPKDAEELGYFWAVTEAKMVEGSAVLMGSNWITPTQSVNAIEPSDDTQKTITEPASPLTKSMFKVKIKK